MFVILRSHVLKVGFALCLCLGAQARFIASGLADSLDMNEVAVLGSTRAQPVSAAMIAGKTTIYSETPAFSENFVNSIGINTDFAYTGTVYGTQFSTIAALLNKLGIKHIRDGIDVNQLPEVKKLARLGIHEDVVSTLTAAPASIISYVGALPTGTVDAVEGLNEWNLSGDPNWAADAFAYQTSLYDALKASPTTAKIPVFAPSFNTYQAAVTAWPQGAYENIADFGNTHDYFGANYPGLVGPSGAYPGFGMYGTLPFWLALAAYDVGPNPLVSTETGYNDGDTYPANSGSVTDSVKARYTMRTLLLSWNYGVERTYLYQLVDVLGQNFGVVTGSLKIKPVYTALANLITDLASSLPAPIPSPLTYSLTVANGVTTIAHTLLQGSASSYHLFVWDEVAAEDPIVPSADVTLTLNKRYSAVRLFRWNDDGSVSSTNLSISAKNSVSFKATDRVAEIRIDV
jgi:hypothetical protein